MSHEEQGAGQAPHEIVDKVIRARHTRKVMLSPEKLAETSVAWNEQHAQALRTMIEGAAWAPFHRRSHEDTHRQGELDSVVPWRFHVLDKTACLALLDFLHRKVEQDADPRWARAWQSKIKNMLCACGALVQATWLPDPAEQGDVPQLTDNNVEHIAATGAAIQNLLLAAEARAWRSYWSSGGILRDPEVFDYLGIGQNESLLGSVFLTPEETEGATLIHGGLREQRGDVGSWSRWVQLP